MLSRPRRNRKSAAIRSLVAETSLKTSQLIYPMFLAEGKAQRIAIKSMPGQFRLSADELIREIEACVSLGIMSYCLFPVVSEAHKDKYATASKDPNGLYPTTIRTIKEAFPEVCIMTDVAMDPYSTDGHDGLVEGGKILNDETLPILAAMALAQAQAGADIIGPSDMMDGRVWHIREELDKAGYTDVSIMSYTAKYASAFYGPFREALDSAPKFGDKKTYQMNPANIQEALREADIDAREGADILMVKPALAYLDVIKALADTQTLPISCYNVSGEYAMIKAAAAQGWIDGPRTMAETLLAMRRAGASTILTYFAKEFAQLFPSGI
jgi:porphobilinogen synthase